MILELLALLAASPLQIVPHPPGVTTLMSVASDGTISNGISINSSVSDDGRFVTFESDGSNLVPGDTNNHTDVFLHDRLLGTTTRLSVTADNMQVAKGGRLPVISGDGTKVVFISDSHVFATGDTNGAYDVIVRDVATGTNTVASVNSAGSTGDQSSFIAALSEDGRFVAFASSADNLVPGDDNGHQDVFVRDMQLGVTERVSVATDGTQGNGDSFDVVITPDGRFVAFSSAATNFAPGDFSLQLDVFVHDRLLGTTECVSTTPAGQVGNQDSFFSNMTPDGRYVTFMSRSNNLVPGDANGVGDVFLKDRLTGAIELISVGWQGQPVIEASDSPDISADARFVVFGSVADNLIPPGSGGVVDHHEDHEIFLRDRLLGTTKQLSLTPDGKQADLGSITAFITPDGSVVSWETYASNIAIDATDTNGVTDVVVRDLSPWTDMGGGLAGVHGVPTLAGHGLLVPFTDAELDLAGAASFAPTLLVVALQGSQVPFKGGVLVAFPFVAQLPVVPDAAGALALPVVWPDGVSAGTTIWFQALLQDAAAVQVVAISTTLAAVTP
ncbi:MAG TPA: calcium-binding protein [Planctomycetota bacterium]|nr:calcium-binding protein [Planctomycetota bacterium]